MTVRGEAVRAKPRLALPPPMSESPSTTVTREKKIASTGMRSGVKTPQVPVSNPVETHLHIKIFATRPVLYVKVLLARCQVKRLADTC